MKNVKHHLFLPDRSKLTASRFAILILTVSLLAFFSGCASLENMYEDLFMPGSDEKSAQSLAYDGMDKFNSGDYKKAIEDFSKIRDWYPYSKFAILAELKIADAQYKLENYEEAIFSYEDFERLHPKNEATPYVVYQIGMCYFDQIDTPDRDQSFSYKSLESFRRLAKAYPNNPYADRARVNMKECLKALASHEFYVGHFYFKSREFEAALVRFKTVLDDYPDIGVHRETLEYYSLSESGLVRQKAEKAKRKAEEAAEKAEKEAEEAEEAAEEAAEKAEKEAREAKKAAKKAEKEAEEAAEKAEKDKAGKES